MTDYRATLGAVRIRPFLLVAAGMEDVAAGVLPVAVAGIDPDDPEALRAKAKELARNSPGLFREKPETSAVPPSDSAARRDELRRLGIL